MKRCTLLLTLAVVILASLLVSACDLGEKVSPEERMSMFVTDLNSGQWSNLKGHTHMLSLMHNLANEAFWQTLFYPEARPLTAPTVAGKTAVCLTSDGLIVTFTLDEETPKLYKIRSIKIADLVVFQ